MWQLTKIGRPCGRPEVLGGNAQEGLQRCDAITSLQIDNRAHSKLFRNISPSRLVKSEPNLCYILELVCIAGSARQASGTSQA